MFSGSNDKVNRLFGRWMGVRKEKEKIFLLGGEKTKLEKRMDGVEAWASEGCVALLKSSEAVPSQMIRHKGFLSSCLFSIQYSSLCLNSGIYPSVRPDLMQYFSCGILLEQV